MGYLCFTFFNKDTKTFVLKDSRTGRWIKRPILDIKKIHSHKSTFYDKDFIPYYSPHIPWQLDTCIKREHQLFDYLDNIIEEEGLRELTINTNGWSGLKWELGEWKKEKIPGDIHIFKPLHY